MAFNTKNFVIASGQTASAAVDCDKRTPLALDFPTVTGTSFTITECDTPGGTFKTASDRYGNALSMANPSGKIVHLPPSEWLGMKRYLKLVSGSTEAGERTIAAVFESVEG